MCHCTNEDIQQFVYESDFQPRTVDDYDSDVQTCMQSHSHSHGVKSACCLNMIEGFHVTENYCVDPMHTLLEVIVPYELGCILFHVAPRLVTLDQLNSRIHCFFDRNLIDKHNRPLTEIESKLSEQVCHHQCKQCKCGRC